MRAFFSIILLISPFMANIYANNHSRETHLDFFTLEGKETPFWHYINWQHDKDLINTFRYNYELNIHKLLSNSKSNSIPKKIHVIWLGPRPFPINSLSTIRSWIKHHPDWEFHFWSDRERVKPFKNMQFHLVNDAVFTKLKPYYEASTNWAEKSDILRYEILLKEGGIYIDHDAYCLQPFNPFVNAYDFFCCLEVPHEHIDGFTVTAGIGLIGAKPSHKIIQGAIDFINTNWDQTTKKFSTHDSLTQMVRVMHRTYIALTHSLKQNLNPYDEKNIVLPASYFYPLGELKGLYSKHLYGTSWNFYGEETKPKLLHSKLKKPYKKLSKVINLYAALTFISLIVAIMMINIVRRIRP